MLTSIRLPARKGLPQLDLHGLGKVNVLCGRNNSGKSTVLNAIADRTTALRGSSLEGPEEGMLVQAVFEAAGVAAGSQGHPRPLRIRMQVGEAIRSRPVWFPTEDHLFIEAIREHFDADPNTRGRHWNAEHVRTRYRAQEVWSYPETKLIPAKRELEIVKGINLGEGVDTRGIGVLNYLFRTKNQLIGNPDRKFFDDLASAFQSISDGFGIGITPDNSNQLHLSFAGAGNPHIPAADCGLGLQDLLLLLYFALLPGDGLLLVEEPESHLHPEIQRRLLAFLRTSTSRQIFLATHSSVMLDSSLVDRVLFTAYTDRIRLDDATSRASILDNLGYSVTDNLVSDVIVLVEGPSDIPVIEHFASALELTPRFNIRYWPLGGDIMSKVDLSVFRERHALIAVVDKDPGSKSARKAFIAECARQSVEVFQLRRRAIENYFTPAALRAVFKGQVPETFVKVDPDVPLREQLGFDVKSNNQKIARAMSLNDLAGTDLREFLDRLALCLSSHGRPR